MPWAPPREGRGRRGSASRNRGRTRCVGSMGLTQQNGRRRRAVVQGNANALHLGRRPRNDRVGSPQPPNKPFLDAVRRREIVGLSICDGGRRLPALASTGKPAAGARLRPCGQPPSQWRDGSCRADRCKCSAEIGLSATCLQLAHAANREVEAASVSIESTAHVRALWVHRLGTDVTTGY